MHELLKSLKHREHLVFLYLQGLAARTFYTILVAILHFELTAVQFSKPASQPS